MLTFWTYLILPYVVDASNEQPIGSIRKLYINLPFLCLYLQAGIQRIKLNYLSENNSEVQYLYIIHVISEHICPCRKFNIEE